MGQLLRIFYLAGSAAKDVARQSYWYSTPIHHLYVIDLQNLPGNPFLPWFHFQRSIFLSLGRVFHLNVRHRLERDLMIGDQKIIHWADEYKPLLAWTCVLTVLEICMWSKQTAQWEPLTGYSTIWSRWKVSIGRFLQRYSRSLNHTHYVHRQLEE